ncbi:hypothetical protein NQ315_001469 [Exocentrus adspersus]|uniref:Beta-glucuronidase n=1 Tax=Exocentrus adspersus TaxID=1586481 RepID=A0AAV8W9P0_9CUCU|nr:hypothetical protein NQ315_001469 [Exocentrus adspersus]
MSLPAALCLVLMAHVCSADIHRGGILYPRESETRQVVSLDGIWNFVVPNTSNPFIGFDFHWYKKDLKEQAVKSKVLLMPVPSSYNDITTDWRIRDHVGLVWYDRTFFVPKYWSEIGRIWLRFGSVSYASQVWINGQLAMSHEIGHLPFHSEITQYLKFGKENRVTVACDNTLLADTIPQGRVEELESGRLYQSYTFDFFNYAGIDRPVMLYTTPKTYIDDISVLTIELQPSLALLEYNITIVGDANVTCRVSLIDKHRNVVATADEDVYGVLRIENPQLWWPYLMHPEPGYLYTFQVELLDDYGDLLDKYNLPVGLRTVTWTNTSLLINNYQVYLHGFGRHEDADIRGKGLDLPLVVRDHNLVKWVGANVYRTSHYPYAEEIMDVADEMGIMIIDECSSVNTEFFIDSLLAKHKISLTELIKRDKNRPSVIMWSAANEPRTQKVIEHIKSLDSSRPTTIAEAQNVNVVESSRYVDIISFNRYNGWYNNEGNLDIITDYVVKEATAWHQKFRKPVIMQEYGGDTLEGLHFAPGYIWSEEYQVELLSKHFEAFDRLRASGFFIGEFIWNFADFKTAQTYTRVGGNKKGIFTRSRQPKASAHHIRRRYWALASEYYNATPPRDLTSYVASRVRLNLDEL